MVPLIYFNPEWTFFYLYIIDPRVQAALHPLEALQ
jgi:hypothetical protein